MTITFTRHRDQIHPSMPGSYLLVGTAFVHGRHQATGVFVAREVNEKSARKQIKTAFRKFRELHS